MRCLSVFASVAALAGVVLICCGIGMVWLPGAWLASGVFLLLFGLWLGYATARAQLSTEARKREAERNA